MFDKCRYEYIRGSDQTDNIAHESGHMIVYAILTQKYNINTPKGISDLSIDWKEGITANEILTTAIEEMKKSRQYAEKTRDDILFEFSQYVFSRKENLQADEAIAEAVSDYYKNGENAMTLSKILFGILKQEYQRR